MLNDSIGLHLLQLILTHPADGAEYLFIAGA
jgi:hypothetical protein